MIDKVLFQSMFSCILTLSWGKSIPSEACHITSFFLLTIFASNACCAVCTLDSDAEICETLPF